MSRPRYNKIPIWENKQRIEYLTFWRDLWLEGMFALNETPESPITRKPLSQAERITELNRRIPAVREMVRLANIQTLRNWRTFRKDDPPIRLDILEEFWNVHQLRLSPRAPSDVVDEAIGRYQADQRGSWIRTFNPLYWIERLIESLIDKAFNVVALFGGSPEAARNSTGGRIVFAIGAFSAWCATIGGFVIALLEFSSCSAVPSHTLRPGPVNDPFVINLP